MILDGGRAKHRKYSPYAFTEQGAAMLSSVLRCPRAVMVNIAIMRAFVRPRRLLLSHQQLGQKLPALERKYDVHPPDHGRSAATAAYRVRRAGWKLTVIAAGPPFDPCLTKPVRRASQGDTAWIW